ncbi:peroxiredoxin [Rhodobacter calidifons]|uniref:Glutathione-dependent peroxiredoxin n=1 Tax=Rhodobacter calidifons TaxID=2715277 RepID=A0ABX0G563_9RHOB|nr:peroxiredoxin [Rhodobacter calidifons]NHB76375.1 peroxiredoxin [Rhodobacter calidifons]
MTIAEGMRLPDAALLRMGDNGAETVSLADRLRGRKVVIFGLPGAYTGTCSTAHVPSFIRTASGFAAKGVDEIICIAVNDPFVMKAWGEATGATAAGITMLADADASFTRAIGMTFDVPQLGFFARSRRYSALVEDGVVTKFNPEPGTGCEISAGEYLLAQL